MTRRMIDSSMWQNEKFAELPMGARLLQIGIINQADDQGRVKANPAYLRAQVFPYDDIGSEQVQEWLELIQKNDTIRLYTADGKQYGQLLKWWDYQSLQYAQPSEYPRPSGWKDRIRRTFTKGEIVTCNWLRVNGEPIPDTCDMNGMPIIRHSVNGSKPPTPSPKSPAQQSGAASPVDSPESSPDDTTYSYNIKLNDNSKGDDLTGNHARTCETIPAASPSPKFSPPEKPLVPHKPQFNGNSASSKAAQPPLKTDSPYLDPRRFANGYIPPGTGLNPVEVFYERHSIREYKLSAPLEDDIARAVTDLDLWRKTVSEWQQHGYKPLNINGQLEWYLNGGKGNAGNGYSTNGTPRGGKSEFGILTRGAQDRERVAANKPTPDEIERGRAERRARKAAGLTFQQWEQQQRTIPPA